MGNNYPKKGQSGFQPGTSGRNAPASASELNSRNRHPAGKGRSPLPQVAIPGASVTDARERFLAQKEPGQTRNPTEDRARWTKPGKPAPRRGFWSKLTGR